MSRPRRNVATLPTVAKGVPQPTDMNDAASASVGPTGRVRSVDAERQSLARILTLIRSGAATTRQEIEKQSTLGRAIVADRLATLGAFGLIEEGELGPAMGGRAPRVVRFRADAARILVATFDAASLGVGVADLAGRVLIEHHEAANLALGQDAMLKRLDTLFDWLREEQQDGRPIWGIGVAVPGPVEASVEAADARPFAPRVLHSLPTWNGRALVAALARRHRAPVWVDSLVQMMTLGEFAAGGPLGGRHLMFVDLGAEISAGLILGGRPHRGAQGVAGRIGHVCVDDESSIVCRCGNTGCLEALAGAEAIVREALLAAGQGRSRQLADALAANGELTVFDVGLAAQQGDAFSAELLSRCGRLIGSVLAALANTLNPSIIMLGGDVAQTGDILLAAIREAIYRRSHPLVTRDLRVARSQMGGSAGLGGAALAAASELFSGSLLSGWIALGAPPRHPAFTALLAQADQAASSPAERPSPPVVNRARRASPR